MEYKVVLTRDSETKWYVVEVPNLPGCISQGKTKAEALVNIKDAISGYLGSVRKHPEERIYGKTIEIESVSV